MEDPGWPQVLGWLPFQIFVCLLVSTTHLRRTSGKIARSWSSVLLFLLIPFILGWHSNHLCDQGSAPPFVKYGFGFLGAILPWVFRSSPWVVRAFVIPILLIGVPLASYLTASYHRSDITGNPYYSRGRFWHTPFTGQYLRESKEAGEAREAEIQRLREM